MTPIHFVEEKSPEYAHINKGYYFYEYLNAIKEVCAYHSIVLFDLHSEIGIDSKNHHMYSDFMSWLIKTPGGIRLNEEKCRELEFDFAPHFIKGIDFVNLSYQTVKGNITVNWKKNGNTVNITLKKDAGVKIKYNDKYIENEFNEWNIRL